MKRNPSQTAPTTHRRTAAARRLPPGPRVLCPFAPLAFIFHFQFAFCTICPMPILKLFLLFAFTIAFSATCAAAALTRLEESTFGKLKDGTPVKIFTLRNEHGMSAKIMEHGAIVTELLALDRQGRATNVLLGAKSLNEYLNGFGGSAAVIGRFANRIADAKFTLDGVEYKLAANNGKNHLHGGRSGFASKNWKGQALMSHAGESAVQ